jgi:hypothetical protein
MKWLSWKLLRFGHWIYFYQLVAGFSLVEKSHQKTNSDRKNVAFT